MPDVRADPEKLKQLAKTLTKSADQLQYAPILQKKASALEQYRGR